MKVKIAIIGITGYSGLELLEIALRHPGMQCVALLASDATGEKPVAEIHPRLRNLCDLVCFPWNLDRLRALEPETVFLCTPNETSHALVPPLLNAGIKVIDLSGAFRLRCAKDYKAWYGLEHQAPALLATSCYGLTEWNAGAIADASLVANPGCYSTCALLALLPLVKAEILEPGSDIICDAKSGVTGAGRSPKFELMSGEVADNFRAYSPVTHRHAPEICQEMGWNLDTFTFVPHLLPLNRGILSTIYVKFKRPMRDEEIEAEYARRYAAARFVRILRAGSLPDLHSVAHTNFCDIGWRSISGGKRAVLFAALDNLVKGAAGQAVQNFNLMYRLEETTGLLGNAG